MFLLLLACTGADPDAPSDPIDLVTPLGEGQARAGVVTDEAALFGGVAAEGRVGDIKLYNSRVRFILQGARTGDYLLGQGGAVVDADVTRPEGQPGRDLVDDWTASVGIGQIMAMSEAEIVDDGQLSGRAVLRVAGPGSPFHYLNGAMESDTLMPDQGLWFSTVYTLEADSPLLHVETTLTALREDAPLQAGDVLLGAREQGQLWAPGVGRTDGLPDGHPWSGFVSKRADLAVGMFSEPGAVFTRSAGLDVLNGLISVSGSYQPSLTLAQGESLTWSRYYGVGPDLATLSDAWLALSDGPIDTIEDQITAPDGPVAGAWVNVLVDGAPYTLALTDGEGRFSAQVPAGAQVSLLADGRGPGLHSALPPGAAPYSPYAAAHARDAALESWTGDAVAVPHAMGRGVGTPEAPLTLQEPGLLTLTSPDGLPFEARLLRDGGDPVVHEGLVTPRPHGHQGLAWAAQGEVTLPLEPGDYSLLVQRGVRFELFEAQVQLVAGQTTQVQVELEPAFTAPGWWVADPHAHSAPSPDGEVTMRERLLVAAGTGVQLFFGTEHDHVVDFSPLVEPLGLAGAVHPIVASEVSPVLRGHLNTYPLTPAADAPNGGAWLWWTERVFSTEEEFEALRAHNPGAVIQANHPMTGLASAAGWSPGNIANGEYWTTDVDAVEVLNGGDHSEAPQFYLDLINRGMRLTPIGSSDSHSHLSNNPGLSVTFMAMSEPGPEGVVAAVQGGHTVVSYGVFLDMSLQPGDTVGAGETLTVQALSPSWAQVDRLLLLRDGQEIDRVQGEQATWTLEPEQDASYVVVAEGDQSMRPLTGRTPWAMSSAIRVDVDGDGWQAPLPSLVVED